MLKTIAIVTLVVRSLGGVEPAYQDELGYQPVDRGRISGSLARTWDTPAMAGQRYVVMQPASGEAAYLRIIEAAPGTRYFEPFRTSGWTAAELLVTDPDALAASFSGDSAFRVTGPPRDLMPGPNAPRAFQAVGPANEPLYFTRFAEGGSGLDLGRARTPVDRVFIMVAGARDLGSLRDYWGKTLGLPLVEFGAWQISVLAQAWNLPPETKFPLAGAALPKNFMIELDDYPDEVPLRARAPGALPAGWAMVSFTIDDLDALPLDWRSKPRPLRIVPYAGRKAAATIGPAGEWIEVIESPPGTLP
jgi:hypothetical protein